MVLALSSSRSVYWYSSSSRPLNCGYIVEKSVDKTTLAEFEQITWGWVAINKTKERKGEVVQYECKPELYRLHWLLLI